MILKVEYVKKKQKEIIQKAKDKATKFKGITKISIYIALSVLSIGITLLFAIGTWKISDLTDVSLVWSYVYVGSVSIVCLVITIFSIVKWLSYYVSKVAVKIYDYCYSREIKKHKEFFD